MHGRSVRGAQNIPQQSRKRGERKKKLPHKPGLLVFTAELQRNGGTKPKYNGPLVTPRLALGDLSSNRYSGRYCGEKMDCDVFFNPFRHLRCLEDLTLNCVSFRSVCTQVRMYQKMAVDGWTSILGIVETI